MVYKLYLSGKVTGLDPRVAAENFGVMEDYFLERGFKVVNPMKLRHSNPNDWEKCMKLCIREMMRCNCIHMLDGFETSKGAMIEKRIAEDVGYFFVSQKNYVYKDRKTGGYIITNDK